MATGQLLVPPGSTASRIFSNSTFTVSSIIETGDKSITSGTLSTSTTSGALKVTGGAGITGDLYIGGGVYTSNVFPLTPTGTLNIGGGTSGKIINIGVSGDTVNINGTVALSSVADYKRFISFEMFLADVGVWITTRESTQVWKWRKNTGSLVSTLVNDISEPIRTASGKGFKLDSIDIIYKTSVLAPNSIIPSLKKRTYAHTVAPSLGSELLSDVTTLTVATSTNPRVITRTLSVPAYNNTADSAHILEIAIDTIGVATATIDFYGIGLNFTRNDF